MKRESMDAVGAALRALERLDGDTLRDATRHEGTPEKMQEVLLLARRLLAEMYSSRFVGRLCTGEALRYMAAVVADVDLKTVILSEAPDSWVLVFPIGGGNVKAMATVSKERAASVTVPRRLRHKESAWRYLTGRADSYTPPPTEE